MLMNAGGLRLAAHAEALAGELVEAVQHLGWIPFRSLGSPAASKHIISLRHSFLSAHDVQQTLADRQCIIVSSRGGGIRVSLHGYNDSDDISELADALANVSTAS
jgi:cysteine desulfurase / selenocysteine lyase